MLKIQGLPLQFGEFTLKYYDHIDWRIMNFRNQDEYKHIVKRAPNYFDAIIEAYNGNIYSIVKGDIVLGFVAFFPSFFESVEVALFPAVELDSMFGLDALKAMKYVFDSQKKNYARIQTTCDIDDKIMRWMKFWGFKKECLLPKYGLNGRDRYLYSIVN